MSDTKIPRHHVVGGSMYLTDGYLKPAPGTILFVPESDHVAEIERLASVATAEMKLREGNFETIERLTAERDALMGEVDRLRESLDEAIFMIAGNTMEIGDYHKRSWRLVSEFGRGKLPRAALAKHREGEV